MRSLPQTFHTVPCLDVHVDAMDVAGENQIDIDHDMTKQRLDAGGLAIGKPFSEIVSGSSLPTLPTVSTPLFYCSVPSMPSRAALSLAKDVAVLRAAKGILLRYVSETCWYWWPLVRRCHTQYTAVLTAVEPCTLSVSHVYSYCYSAPHAWY